MTTVAALRERLEPGLVEWFRPQEDDAGDGPELHLVGLREGDLVACFAAIAESRPRWNDRTFYIDDEEIDVTVEQRPDVAELVAAGRSSVACVGAQGIAVEGVELPLVEMFLLPEEIELFWWPSFEWSPERVAAFFALMLRLLELAPAAALRPDPRYTSEARRTLGALIARLLGDDARLDYGR
jgi:hypothetical protein